MRMEIMSGCSLYCVTTNATAIPRVGDKVEINRIKYEVKEVIWHMAYTTWVEVQV